MAAEKNKANEEKRVLLKIPFAEKGEEDTVYISVNFKSYLIKRGVPAMVPPEVKRVWDDSQEQKEKSILYSKEKELTQEKMQYFN